MKKRYLLFIFMAIIIIGIAGLSLFTYNKVTVTGCDVVDEQVVIDSIASRGFANNSIVLYISNKIDPIKDIPFVAALDIEFISKNEISVTVYEKSIAGCIEYMNGYVYFDKDGLVLESSQEMIEGIPCIKGLNFNQWEMGEKLPIDDVSKFNNILSITQLIEKYELSIDSIKFTSENEIVLAHEGITIELGEGEYLAVQMMNLGSILKGLDGLEGVLYMKDFNSDEATASFSKKK